MVSGQSLVSVQPQGDDLGTLIARTAGGEEAALAALYDSTAALVNGLVLRILGDRGAAEEVTGDVYLQVWRQAVRHDETRGAPLSWLLTLARSRAIDRLRSGSRQRARTAPLFERHLAGGCRACTAEVASLAATADALALAADPVAPRPAVRAQLLVASRSQRSTPDLYPVLLHDQGQWSEIAAGVLRKDLTGSAAGGTISYLVRMRARSRVPRHLHDAVEHCYVVEGDVCIQGRQLRAGDFTAAQPGTEHDDTTTDGGCLLVIVESRPQLQA